MSSSQFESLETRRLLFGTVQDVTLTIVGTSKDDQIVVARSGDGQLVVTRNGEARSFDLADPGRIVINSFRGSDVVRILTGDRVTVNAAAGNDVVYGGGSRIVVDAAEGNDTVYGSGRSTDYLVGGAGDDSIDGGSGADVIYGDNYEPITKVPDAVFVGFGNDTLIGSRGADVIDGQAGNNLIYGGADADHLLAWGGNDTLYAGAGMDTIIDGAGADQIFGEADGALWRATGPGGVRMTLDGLANDGRPGEKDDANGIRAVQGGDGDDFLDFTHADGPTHATTYAGVDTVIGSRFNDTIETAESVLAGDGDDNIFAPGDTPSTLVGGTGNDTIIAGRGNDSIEGNAGNDTLDGREGNDTISGNRGFDIIRGGTGDDLLLGGPDAADHIFGDAGNDAAAEDEKDTYEDVETLLT